jgi:hypothetical protein
MKTLVNYLKYYLGAPNNGSSYYAMRQDYLYSTHDIINKISKLNGLLHPKHSIAKSDGILGSLSNKDVSQISGEIKKNGYYIFPDLLPNDKVEDMRNFALNSPMHYLKVEGNDADYSPEGVMYKDSKTLSNRFQVLNPASFSNNETILKIVTDENLLHIANDYLGSMPILDLIVMWWSTSLEDIDSDKKAILKSKSAQMFHFDMDRLKFLKFFVYLTDVDANTGPHVYVKSSHNKLPHYIKKDGRYTDEHVSEHDKQNIVEITGKAGSIIAVDTRGLHKGKELTEGERLIFQLEFTNSLFGNPEIPQNPEKFKYKGNSKYFETYKCFFKK